MPTKFDTKDWELEAILRWKRKPHACVEIECPDCNGRGEYTGHRAMFMEDDERKCRTCHGRRVVHNGYQAEPIPDWPRGLGRHLRETLEAYEPPKYITGIDHHPV